MVDQRTHTGRGVRLSFLLRKVLDFGVYAARLTQCDTVNSTTEQKTLKKRFRKFETLNSCIWKQNPNLQVPAPVVDEAIWSQRARESAHSGHFSWVAG